MSQAVKNKGWKVTFAGTGINLALGILYTWSIFKGAIKQSIETGGPGAFNWDLASLNDPYAVCCLVFAFAMIGAGKCQDKFGPRITALIGGVLVGLGFIWISQTTSYINWVLGFGVLAGIGIGFGYSSATPPALKWFPPAKTGLIAGLVVSGFGLASVYIAPLAKYLLSIWGLQGAMMFFGVGFLIVVSFLAMFLVNPPAGYVPEGAAPAGNANPKTRIAPAQGDSTPSMRMKTPTFWILWTIYLIGSGAGLMVVAIPVVGAENTSAIILVILATLIGFNYGTNLCLFPSFTKDLWGLKNFGINYGLVFTAWGVGGLVMSRMSQMLKASTGTFNSSFVAAGVLLIIGTLLTFTLKGKRA